MRIDLTKVQETPVEFDVEIPGEEIDLEGENIRLKGPVRVAGTIERRGGDKFDIAGTITADAESDCTRCLEAVETPVSIELSATYAREDEFAGKPNAELAEDDLETDLLMEEMLDTAEMAREQILLGIPEQLYCKEDCKGLCAKCGENLNLINCNCKESETDPRWAALKNIN